MEYISYYLRQYAQKHDNNTEMEVREETAPDGSKHNVYLTLPILLREAAGQIECMKKRLAELEHVDRIIKLAEGSRTREEAAIFDLEFAMSNSSEMGMCRLCSCKCEHRGHLKPKCRPHWRGNGRVPSE